MAKKKAQPVVSASCDHCGREVVQFTITSEDFAVESTGDKQHFKKFDFSQGVKFCSVACLHEWIDEHYKLKE